MSSLFDLPFEEPEEEAPAPPAPVRRVLTVSQLTGRIRTLLEEQFLETWVEGEISNLARPSSGHIYFSLKDATAQVRCAMFRMSTRRLGFEPENGLKVLVRAQAGLYEPRGEYQLVVEHMEPAGAGALRQRFEALKAKLAAYESMARLSSMPARCMRAMIHSSFGTSAFASSTVKRCSSELGGCSGTMSGS